jgi:molybdopterin/thiamine biosynthesis adenylyltransferase
MKSTLGDRLRSAIGARAETIYDPAGRSVAVLREAAALELAARFECHLRCVYAAAAAADVCPLRYLRNRGSITANDQRCLIQSCVGVVGAGGLGGQVLLALARIGVGRLVVIDPDRFEESNLNRQAFARPRTLGKPKAPAAAAALQTINPAVEVTSHHIALDADNGAALLHEVQVVVDALDSIAARLVLAQTARQLGLPLVHGALAGFSGQVMSIFPEDPGLELVYGLPAAPEPDPGRPEAQMGVPGITPGLIAGLQAMEVVKILLGRGRPLRKRLLFIDLEAGEFDEMVFA